MSNAINTPNRDLGRHNVTWFGSGTDPAVNDTDRNRGPARSRGPRKGRLWRDQIRQLLLRMAYRIGNRGPPWRIVTGVGAALGLSRTSSHQTQRRQTESIGFVGGIILLAIIFVSYLAGGYVAGRMARFNGLQQGLGVWLWAVIMAILIAGAGWLAGARFDVFAQVNSFPRLPLNEGTLTTAGVLAAIGVVAEPHRGIARRTGRDALSPPS